MNWRSHIIQNRRKTYYVFFSFLCLYLLMGWLLIIFMHPESMFFDYRLLLIETNQYIMLFFLSLSLFFIVVGAFWGSRLSVMGANAVLVDQDHESYRMLYNVVEEMKIASSLSFMPKIYVLEVEYANAFASGFSEKNASIAITKPLLTLLNREELQAVVAHELSHIKHQDIRVMTLVMVCSNVLVFLIDVLFRSVLYGDHKKGSRKKEQGSYLLLIVILLRFLMPVVTSFLVMYVSRKREFLADAGCVRLTRNPKALAQALQKIHDVHQKHKKVYQSVYQQTPHEGMRNLAYIYAPSSCGISNWMDVSGWFATHPSLEARLKALGV